MSGCLISDFICGPCNPCSTPAASSETYLKMTFFKPRPKTSSDLVLALPSEVTSEALALVLVCWYVWVGPVPGLEVAPECFQVNSREVGTDAFPQPPLPLCGTATAGLTELVNKVFSSHPPERDTHMKHQTNRKDRRVKSECLFSKSRKSVKGDALHSSSFLCWNILPNNQQF